MQLDIIFTLIGLVTGLSSLGYLSIAYRKGPEALKQVVLQTLLGVSIMAAAFAWDLAFELYISSNWNLPDLHHLLLAASILFFANAARKMYGVGR